MATAWRKDGEVLYDAEVQNYARYQEGELVYTTVLHLLNVNFTDEGRYQCVVSNHFGANYSNRAKLTVNGVEALKFSPQKFFFFFYTFTNCYHDLFLGWH